MAIKWGMEGIFQTYRPHRGVRGSQVKGTAHQKEHSDLKYCEGNRGQITVELGPRLVVFRQKARKVGKRLQKKNGRCTEARQTGNLRSSKILANGGGGKKGELRKESSKRKVIAVNLGRGDAWVPA